MKKLLLTLLCCLTMVADVMGQFASAPAFPGAEGYGRYVTGGRGGEVRHVTNLNDSGTGSFRAAVNGSSKKIVVFDVAGVIALESDLTIGANTTILGQTAPGDGITLRYYTVKYAEAGNIIMRYMRIRRGQEKDINDGADATWTKNRSNIILDHCSFSWSIDEVASFYDNKDFTMQWCTIGEPLKYSGHEKGPHGYGGIWGGKGASFHHNLLIHLDNRAPRLDGARFFWKGPNGTEYSTVESCIAAEKVDLRNCVIYNTGTGNGAYGGMGGNHNIVNNYYKAGPATKNTTRVFQCSVSNSSDGTGTKDANFPGGIWGKFYISGNYVTEAGSSAANYDWNGVTIDNCKDANVTTPTKDQLKIPEVDKGSVTTHSAQIAYEKVLIYAGASKAKDCIDTRYEREVRNNAPECVGSATSYIENGTSHTVSSHPKGIIDVTADALTPHGGVYTLNGGTKATDTDGDGIPDEWEDAHDLNKNSAADALTYTLDSRGYYQNIEVYANYLVQDITKAERAGAAESFEEYYPIASADPTDPTTPETDPTPSTGTLTWDYTSAAPSSNPDNGLNYASTVNDASGTNNGLKGIKLNSTGYCYFTKSAVAGTLAITFGPRTGTNATSISVYSYASTPSAETIIGTTETTTALATKTIELSAEQNNIYLIRGASTETVITKIVFTPSTDDSSDDNDDDDATIEDPDPAPVAVKPAAKKAFDFIVGKDGDADAAIAAANSASGSGRYLIFVPNGTYDMTTRQSWTLGSDKSAMTGTDGSTVSPGSTFYNNATWLTRSNVSIIGQSESGTKLRNTPIYPGISYTSTLEIRSGNSNTYIQDLTLYNNYANGANDKGVAVAFYDRGTNTILKNVNCWSNQDTYTSAATRCYYETSTFAGTVDFICGSGDVWFEKCDLVINDRSGNVITAPATKSTEPWGYVFNGCTISKAAGATKVTDKNWTLGRPWKEAPASTFINTKMNVLPSDAGWTKMNDGLTIRFHEYGSTNSSGTALDLSKRSVSACNGAKADKPVLTAAQASTYKVSSVLGGDSNWDPRALALLVNVSNAKLDGNTLSWDNNDYALCWVVFKNGEYYANPTTNSIALTESGTYTVRAANSMGGLGEVSSEVVYTAAAATYTVSYNINGHGTAVDDVTETTTLPSSFPTLSADGYAFWGWYTDEACTTAAVANAPISKNTTLYAKWTNASTTPGAWSIDFSDIGASESLADKAGVTISSKVAKIGSTDFGLTKMGNTYLDSRFVIQTGTSWIYRTAQKAIYSSNSGDRSFGMRNMKAGQSITMKIELGESATTIAATNATLKSSENNIWTYDVTADGDVAFSINRYSYIYSIEVSEAPVVTEEQLCPINFAYTISNQDNTAGTYYGVNGKATVVASNKVETKENKDGFKLDGDSETKYIKVTLNDELSAGDIITISILTASTPSGSDYGVSIGTSAFTALNTLYCSAKNTWEEKTLTIANGSKLIGKKEFYLFRATGKSTYVSSINVEFKTPSAELTMSDGYSNIEDIIVRYNNKEVNIVLERSIPEKSWSTLVVPFDVPTAKLISTFPDPNNSEVAVIQRFENNTLYFKTQDHINANEPVLIYLSKTNADNVYDFGEVTVKNGVAESTNGDVTMVGTYKNVLGTSLDNTKYYFISGNKFYDTSYMSSMKPFRAYFCINNASGAKQINLGFGDFTTSMNNVRIQMVDTEKPIYNMAGQRVTPGTKGLLIQNGKKILVK